MNEMTLSGERITDSVRDVSALIDKNTDRIASLSAEARKSGSFGFNGKLGMRNAAFFMGRRGVIFPDGRLFNTRYTEETHSKNSTYREFCRQAKSRADGKLC